MRQYLASFLNRFACRWVVIHKKDMNLMRLTTALIAALMVGCASGSQIASAPAPYYQAPAAAVTSANPNYVPVFVPGVITVPQSVYGSTAITASEPVVLPAPVYGSVAENGSYYGQPNVNGVPKTVGDSVKRTSRRDKGNYLEPPSLDISNPDMFLERMRQKHGEVSDIEGKKFIFIDNRFPLCRVFRKGYYRIDNLSLTDKLEMLDIFIQMQKHLEKLDVILKGPDDEEGIKRGMLMMNQWVDDGRNLERKLHSILEAR
jgi:hypothetical protein